MTHFCSSPNTSTIQLANKSLVPNLCDTLMTKLSEIVEHACHDNGTTLDTDTVSVTVQCIKEMLKSMCEVVAVTTASKTVVSAEIEVYLVCRFATKGCQTFFWKIFQASCSHPYHILTTAEARAHKTSIAGTVFRSSFKSKYKIYKWEDERERER